MGDFVGPRHLHARARAKVNLSLHVIRRRRDGYHELETILQSVDYYDELEMHFDRTAEIRLTTTDPEIPTGPENLCYRAVELMRRYAGDDLGAEIHIRKNIPHSAGLGGGSSDAAAVMLGVHRALGMKGDVRELEPAAAELGSDVPFMIRGGTMLGRGRGELLTPLKTLRAGTFLIVKPPVAISTREVFSRINLTLTKHSYRINLNQVNALLARFPNVVLTFRNDLEDVVCPSYPVVSDALGELIASRPRFAAMSGSGSALFAIYDNDATAVDMAGVFSGQGFFTAVAPPAARAVDITPLNSERLQKGGA